ncbi:non-homologous end-joining DNA ligase [Nonomuraea sp. 10N515B]|uniref:non-homologous end-joining DNA ligase n=1 Tax=Nonomuraea sp. 10N515B TaxID=3457422 RepID=UPI003FCC476F
MISATKPRIGRFTVELSNTDKTLFPADHITKGDLIDYYRDIAQVMLPHLKDRPLALARYPDGIEHDRLFQKNVPDYFPDWVTRAQVPKREGGHITQAVCDNAATLVYLANQACIEPHTFLSRTDRLDNPDQLVFDLDPPTAEEFASARETALALRHLLEEELALTTFVKTTGGKGLHVHVPLNRNAGFDEVREVAGQIAHSLASAHPGQMTIEQRKDKRGGRVFLDIMRNAYAQTAVAPYSVRARPGAPVATPLHWDEVTDPALTPDRFTMRTIRDRLDRVPDPWSGMRRHRYGLTALRHRA